MIGGNCGSLGTSITCSIGNISRAAFGRRGARAGPGRASFFSHKKHIKHKCFLCGPALLKSRSAREAGDSIKPGAQAPGSDHKKQARARETGDSVKFTGFRPLSRAPTFFYWYLNLGLAPQALCCRPLRGLYAYGLLSQAKKHHSIEFLCKAVWTRMISQNRSWKVRTITLKMG